MFLLLKTISLSIEKERINSFCEDKHIQSILKKKIRYLSGGELRYLEIKLVLFNSSKFVLLDEPYNGLSPIMTELVNELIKENSKTKEIIISDHNYREVMKISSKSVLIDGGKAHYIKEKAELIEKSYLNNSAFL